MIRFFYGKKKMTSFLKSKFQALESGWYLWIFPLFALAISVWLAVDYFNQRGPTIKIFFQDAAGIQAEKTSVRYKGVPIGVVKKVSISVDNQDVIAEVVLNSDAEHFAVQGSRFGLVLPKVNLQGISGLETIFEGTYISVQPGDPGSPRKLVFKAQTNSPANDSLEGTSPYVLETGNVESINPGDSVFFRGLKIGSVTKLTLAKDSRVVQVQIHIENKYVKVIRTNTLFWRKPAIYAKLGLFNSEIKINSFDTMINGGIDLFTPDPPGEIAKANAVFGLSDAPPEDIGKWNPSLSFNRR